MSDHATYRLLPVVALGLFLLGGCGQTASSPQTSVPGSGAPAISASMISPQRKVLQRIVEQPGTVQASEETQLFVRVPGYVRKLRPEIDIGYRIHGPKYDDSGHEVEPGEVLAELAVPELEAEGKLKQAMVRQAEAEVEQAVKTVAAAEASIAVAQATMGEMQSNSDRWESESKRMTGLVKSRVVSEESAEEAVNQFRAAASKLASARAAVQKVRAYRDRAEADVRAAQARVDVAKADAQRSEAMLGYAKIRAPYDGIVTWRRTNTGTLVQPTGGQGDWLFRVARLDPVRVVLAIPEADADLVKEKSAVKFTVPAVSGATRNGVVTRTSWALEPGARTLRAEVDLPNKDGALRPGMFVSARIVNDLPEMWTLPVAAVVKSGDATVCFLVEDGKAIRTPVQVGRSDGQIVQVVKRQSPGSPPSWEDFTGQETIASRAAGLTDGQSFP
jgi:HlyD family secretion protein